ncbi:toll/interleukin-1 receptor domain-containing protein [Xanthomonas sacchari]|uniref:toll/interleukin-1 receptor domain-containing protein n=1 Tax=Xanthomonas sacchari TaxID=56458 RepID=UPI00225C15C2|nr:toll/interleukin-1 receptor domain-containing protein [Xanthomonas sacchari]UYK72917.1 toll/interleukin-1 receptor domain-containing protein [Xanthomonas sacchari]
MKVFISHQRADSDLSAHIARRLKIYHSIDSYLDLIDVSIDRGEDLALHIQNELGKCTQLLAVISEATRTSWWVPWEIGVATEKDFPLATFSGGTSLPPEYLRKWPYLRSDADLDKYADSSKRASQSFAIKRATLNEGVARVRSTREFFIDLRKSLGQ